MLEPDAVYHLVMAAKETDADLIYSDEAITGEDIARVLPCAPDLPSATTTICRIPISVASRRGAAGTGAASWF